MMRLWLIVGMVACQPLGDTTGELATHDDGQRVYWQMKLDDVGVKLDLNNRRDERMPTKIHALRYMAHETTEGLTLIETRVNLDTVINVADVIFSWRDKNNTYTCHLHGVNLGAQRGIRGNGIDNATFCFEQKNSEGDYVRMLADHCASASNGNEKSRFIFLGGRDFACDLSGGRDKSLLLQASCLAKGDRSCLDGKIRACAEKNEGAFAPFIAEFKSRVNTTCQEPDKNNALKECEDDANTEDKHTITYELKNAGNDLCANSDAVDQDNGGGS